MTRKLYKVVDTLGFSHLVVLSDEQYDDIAHDYPVEIFVFEPLTFDEIQQLLERI